MQGGQVNAGRLFDRDSGRTFVAAIDHGLALGVLPGGERAVDAVEGVVACEPDGVLLSPGMLGRTGGLFAFRGAPVPVVRCDWLVLAERLRPLGEHHRVLCDPAEAAALGAGGVALYLVLGVKPGRMFADNVAAVCRAAQAAHAAGLPLMVETVAWGSRVDDPRDPELLAFGCRMAAELGADMIKTEYTGDPGTMRQIVDGCPAPVLTLGGPRTDSTQALLEATRGAIEAGARGVVYGRNVWQADDPPALAKDIRAIVHAHPGAEGE
ncbi:class I fructose-bisphosphate aldolase [soil metagenome]